ncbi:hypothetical protein [Longispora urticae]
MRWDTVFVERYTRLVRAAYVIDAGQRNHAARWDRAHRVATAAAPAHRWRSSAGTVEEVYAALLTRVVRTAVGGRRARGLRLTRPRATAFIGGIEHATVDVRLAEAEPAVRAGYLLLTAEDVAADEILTAAGVPDVDRVLAEARALADTLDLDREEQRRVLDGMAMNPAVARLSAPAPSQVRRARRAPLVVLGGVAVLLAASGFLVPDRAVRTEAVVRPTEPVAPTVRRAADTAWQGAGRPRLVVWPATGDRRADTSLVAEAVTRWQVGAAQLLYAGNVDGTAVVVLTDGSRLARYTAGTGALDVSPVGDDDVYGSSALTLTPGRYAVAPWISKVEQLTATGERRPVPVTGGVTAKVSDVGPCGRGPLLRLTATSPTATALTVTDGGGVAPAHAMYLPSELPNPVARPHELDSPGAVAAWAQAGCRLPAGARYRTLTLWEFAVTPLPEGRTGRWLCLRGDDASGGSAITVLLLSGTEVRPVDTATDTALCTRRVPDLAAVTWWRAPSGSWSAVAAASRGVDRLELAGRAGDRSVTLGPYPTQPAALPAVRASREGRAVQVVGRPA